MGYSFPKAWFVQFDAGEALAHGRPNNIGFGENVKSEMLAPGADIGAARRAESPSLKMN
jgi:hypothetical protein